MKDSLERLGFFQILNFVSEYCDTEPGKEAVLSLRPLRHKESVESQLRYTSEMRLLLKLGMGAGLGRLRDVRGPIMRLSIEGGRLELEDLAGIRDLLSGYNRLRTEIGQKKDLLPLLWGALKEVDGLKPLLGELERAISPDGELREDASPALRSIRNEKLRQRQNILRRYESLIKEKGLRIEQEISIRGGRYVIPLRVEERGKIKGIVHDYSKSRNTCFLEPLSMVPENNRLHELEEEERQEIRKILTFLTNKLRPYKDQLLLVRDTVASLDALIAKARFAEAFKLNVPELCEDGINLRQAKNPLLMILMKGEQQPVPIDLEIGRDGRMLVVCGPNRGGKTVALRTLGLLCLMTQSGIPIPVSEGSSLRVFREVLAEIGDDQDVFSGESTFSAHAKGLAHILWKAQRDSLILLDEPGMGTSPEEGSAIAIAVLESLLEKGSTVMATTHYDAIKAWAIGREGVKVASVGFDAKTQSPNFRLTYGMVESSHALEIAERSGLPLHVIEKARSFMEPQKLRMEELLKTLEDKLREVEGLGHKYREGIEANLSLKAELEKKEADLRAKVQEITQQKKTDLDKLLLDARLEIARIINSFKAEKGRYPLVTKRALQELREKVAAQLSTFESLEEGSGPELKPGDKVRHTALGKTGTVLNVDGERVLVQFVGLKVEVDKKYLSPIPKDGEVTQGHFRDKWEFKTPLVLELNVIGQRVPEALSMVEKAVNRALVEGREELRIVHGLGTGQLRRAIREHLRGFPYVKGLRSEDPALGGEAVTIVEF